MTDILQFTRLPWLSILNAASQARKQTVQRQCWGSVFLKTPSHYLAIRSLRRKWRLHWSGACFRLKLPPRGLVSSFPGPWLGRAFCLSRFSQKILVLCITLIHCLPQIFKLKLANKKDQVLFSSNRDNVNSGQYCTENEQALPPNPHWSTTSITELVYNAMGLSRNPQNF